MMTHDIFVFTRQMIPSSPECQILFSEIKRDYLQKSHFCLFGVYFVHIEFNVTHLENLPKKDLLLLRLGFNIRIRIYPDNPVIRFKTICIRIFSYE